MNGMSYMTSLEIVVATNYSSGERSVRGSMGSVRYSLILPKILLRLFGGYRPIQR